jgi:hypothetical protein
MPQLLFSQFAIGPGNIKRMLEEMLGADDGINFLLEFNIGCHSCSL